MRNTAHHPALTSLCVVLFWMLAALFVLAAESLPARIGAIAMVAALVLIAFAYTHCIAREAGVAHALNVGIAWLLLSIVAEIALTANGHPKFTLLGSPDRPLLRHVLLFAWIFSPSFFARRTPSS